MAMDITSATLSKEILAKVAEAGLEVCINRYNSSEVKMPTAERGVTLVGFHALSNMFSDFVIDPVDKSSVRSAIAEHLAAQDIDPTSVQVSLVYRTSKRSTAISSSCMYSRNELVGFCYMDIAEYKGNYPSVRGAAVEDFMEIKMQQAVESLTEWQVDNNYLVTFKRDDNIVFRSSTLQKVDWEHYILYHASKVHEQAA